jgi:surface antigen
MKIPQPTIKAALSSEPIMIRILPLLATAAALMFASVSLADPPAHAPAHGWRKKNDPGYVGYTGTQWERDYGVTSGRCNREEIGAVLGGAAGAAVGSRSSDDHPVVATILGAAAGALIGAAIGRELDDADRGCLAHSLEVGEVGRRVTWLNTRTGVTYVLVPEQGKKSTGKACRKFELTATAGKKKEKRRATACQVAAGRWEMR